MIGAMNRSYINTSRINFTNICSLVLVKSSTSGGGGGGNIIYPGLIAAWSAKGKSNDDADRATLKDLTGNGRDITLNGFAFNTEGSGYGNPNYPDALVFDGVDDKGYINNIPPINDVTIILNCDNFCNSYIDAYCLSLFQNTAKNWNDYTSFMRRGSGAKGSFSFGEFYKNSNIPTLKKGIDYCTPYSYNGNTLIRGSVVNSNLMTLTLGNNIVHYPNKYVSMAFYSAYLFDRSLDEQEIKAFIRKYIDPEYLLPSEQYLMLNQGKLNINKLK